MNHSHHFLPDLLLRKQNRADSRKIKTKLTKDSCCTDGQAFVLGDNCPVRWRLSSMKVKLRADAKKG